MATSLRPTPLALSIAAMGLCSGVALADTYAPWLVQMGLNSSVMSAANGGRGLILGVVDTGILATDSAFAAGQVSKLQSSCAAVTFRCSNSYNDDNSHGTAVASIAAGNMLSVWNASTGKYTVARGNVLGMAPNANIIAEKVLSAAGSGYSTDVANGIVKAANAGVAVINLSLTYGNSPDLVSAINYAASKGIFIAWAGGNSAQALLANASTNGLTQAAVDHLILVGSVDNRNVLSSFSNTPGKGSLIVAGSGSTSYANRWVMAPGETILAPVATAGPNAWGVWSGTSMSAPLVSGSLLLLESTWPILKTRGTAANLLLATATDLGSAGVDTTYGRGLVNLVSAFQPYGPLSLTLANGSTLAVGNLTGGMISGGALGSLSAVQSKLANYPAFDSYLRGFTVNLAGLIQSKSTGAKLNALPSYANTGPVVIKLNNGSELGLWQNSAIPLRDNGLPGAQALRSEWQGYAMLTDANGNSFAAGYGAPVQFSWSRAVYGDDELSQLSQELSSVRLSSLAEGGSLLTYGFRLDPATRVAMSWNLTRTETRTPGLPSSPTPEAMALQMGISHRFSDRLTSSLSVGVLQEHRSLLGSAYSSNSIVNLGEHNSTTGLDVSLAYSLTARDNLLFTAAYARTSASQGNGLVSGTTALTSRSWGMGFQHQGLFKPTDRLTVSWQEPLRVVSGKVGLIVPTVDSVTGEPHFGTEWSSASPDGHERDLQASYTTRLHKTHTLGVTAGYSLDAGQVKGVKQSHAGVFWSTAF